MILRLVVTWHPKIGPMKNTLLANQFTYERLECWFWLVMKLLLRIYDWIFQLVLELCPHSRTGSSFDFKNWGFQFWNSLSSWIVSLRKAFEAESHGQCAIRSEGLKSRACGKVFSSVKSYIVGNNVVLFFFFLMSCKMQHDILRHTLRQLVQHAICSHSLLDCL